MNCKWCCTFPTAIRWTSSWHKPFFPWRNRFNSGQKEVVKHVYLPFSVTCLYDLYFRKRNIEKIVEKQFIWREVTWKNVPRHTIVKGRLFSFVPKLSKKIAYFKVIMFLLRHACLSYQKYCCCSPYSFQSYACVMLPFDPCYSEARSKQCRHATAIWKESLFEQSPMRCSNRKF